MKDQYYDQLVILLKKLGLTEVRHYVKGDENGIYGNNRAPLQIVRDEWDKEIGKTKITNLEPPSLLMPPRLFLLAFTTTEEVSSSSTTTSSKGNVHPSGLKFLIPPLEVYGKRVTRIQQLDGVNKHDVLRYGAICLYLLVSYTEAKDRLIYGEEMFPCIAVFTPSLLKDKMEEHDIVDPELNEFQKCMKIWRLENDSIRSIHFQAGFSIDDNGTLKSDIHLPFNKFERSHIEYYNEFYTMLTSFYGIPVEQTLEGEQGDVFFTWPGSTTKAEPCLLCWRHAGKLCSRHDEQCTTLGSKVNFDPKWPASIVTKGKDGNDKPGPCEHCFKLGFMKFCPRHEDSNLLKKR